MIDIQDGPGVEPFGHTSFLTQTRFGRENGGRIVSDEMGKVRPMTQSSYVVFFFVIVIYFIFVLNCRMISGFNSDSLETR